MLMLSIHTRGEIIVRSKAIRYFSKMLVCTALAFSALLMVSLTGMDAPLFSPARVQASQIRVIVDGMQVNFPDAQPIIVQGRTLVPMRGVFEQMGFMGDWNPHTSTSTLMRSEMVVSVRNGDAFFTVNGRQYYPEVPPQILGGRFMIPLRALSEATGAHVEWNENTRTVVITTFSAPPPIVVTPAPMPTLTPIATPTPRPTPTPTPLSTVRIGNQVGDLTAGLSGTVDFPVTTQGLRNGSYQLALRNAPSGVTLQSTSMTVSNNRGTLRLSGNTSTLQGSYRVTVSVNLGSNRWVDQDLTLIISAPRAAEIQVGSQSGTMVQGTANASVSFQLITQNISNGSYNVALISPVPQGISLSSGTISVNSNRATLTLVSDGTTPHGQHNVDFSVTIGSISLNRRATLSVGAQAVPSITSVVQSVGLREGINESTIIVITTQNVPNGIYNIQIPNLVSYGAVMAGTTSVSINNNIGQFTISGTGSQSSAGSPYSLTLVMDVSGQTISAGFSFVVTP